MKDLFVPYELAARLKEKGFNSECLGYYNMITKEEVLLFSEAQPEGWRNNKTFPTLCAPLWQQAIDWLREEKKIDVYVSVMPSHFSIWVHDNSLPTNDPARVKFHEGHFSEYYSALKKGIEKALELIKK